LDGRLGLPVNTVLTDSYRIVRQIGAGGFGITYAAEDITLGTTVAIKEYYPEAFGDRDATMSVRPKSERHEPTFEWGRSSFVQEARTLARFQHASVVRVTRVFEANSTAYVVMDFEAGENFEVWRLGRPPTQEELDRVVAPLLDALEIMHAEDFLHRDIAPDNIIIRADGSPVLLDFGAARRAVAERSRALTGIVKAVYSPHEQYASDGRLQGPWSDLYALGATLYRAVTGTPPEEATLRVGDDRMTAAAKATSGNYRRGFLAGIEACLRVKHADRPQSVAQLRPMLLGVGVQTGRLGVSRGTNVPREGWQAWPAATATVVILLGGAYGTLVYLRGQSKPAAREQAVAVRKTAQQEMLARTEAKRQREEQIAAEQRAREEQGTRDPGAPFAEYFKGMPRPPAQQPGFSSLPPASKVAPLQGRGWLGIMMQSLTEEFADCAGLKDNSGALVAGVAPDSPAMKSGLQEGDIICATAARISKQCVICRRSFAGPRSAGP
jgi:tRNA A-37 threonylcarbamoyl transferase component Bud32